MEQKHVVFLLICAVALPTLTLLAWRFPKLRDWLFGIGVWLTMTLEQYDINLIGREFYRAPTRGIEISFLEVIAAALLLSAPRGPRTGRPPTYWLIWAYTAYAALTIPLNEPMLFGTFELVKLLRALLIFAAATSYVRGPRELRVLLISLAVTVGYESYVAIEQRYVQGMHRIPGSLGHPNNLSVFANLAAPIMLTGALADHTRRLKRLFLISYALCAICVVLTISRTGFAVLGLTTLLVIVSCVKVELTAKKVGAAFLALLLVAGAVYRAKDSIMGRYKSATLKDEVESDRGRGLYFRLGAAVLAERPFGVGLNNWSYVVTNDFYPRLGLPFKRYANTDVDFSDYSPDEAENKVAPPAHNLWILTLGEVGVIGFILFVTIWFRWMLIAFRFVGRRLTAIVPRYCAGVFFSLFSLTLSTMTEYAYRFPQILFLVHLLVGGMMGLILGRQRAFTLQQATLRHEREKRVRRGRQDATRT